MIKYFCRFCLKIWGFTIVGDPSIAINKKMYAVYPHTSNWDFVLGILIKGAIPLDVNYVGKDSLFRFPYGWIFRWMGGIPVKRDKSTNFVDMMAEQYKKYDRLSFGMSPEGTRKKTTKFRSGFYHIAHQAGIPIILVSFDFGHKKVRFSPPFYPTGTYKNDIKIIIDHFKDVKGYHPEQACAWEDEEVGIAGLN